MAEGLGAGGVPSVHEETQEYIEAFERSFNKAETVSYYMAQVILCGPPRVGKTCLYRRLLDQEPVGTRTTHDQPGKGSLSTNVLSENIIVQRVKNESAKVIVADNDKWNEVSCIEDQIAIYMKTTHAQTRIKHNDEPLNENYNPNQSAATNPQHPLKSIVDKIRNYKNVNQLNGNKPFIDDSLMIHFTDTGGQPEFHEVLPALVAGPTVFLLVFSLFESLDSLYEVDYESEASGDFKKYHNSFTVREVLMGCLSCISSFKNAQEQDLSHSVNTIETNGFAQMSDPPIKVLMVGTHCDLIKNERLREINESLYDELEASNLLDNVIAQYDGDERELVIPINNFDPKDGVKLRKFFDSVVYSNRRGVISPFKITLPVNWLGFELSLKMLESSTIKYDDCIDLMHEFHMQDEMELKSCLHFLHYKTGTIRYYGNSIRELEDTVIIKPQVIFAAVTEFITCTFSSRNVPQMAISNFKYYGLFKKEDVEAVFNAHEKKLEITIEQFLALLKHFNILSEWQQQDDTEEAIYFFPCALTHIVRDDQVGSLVSCDPLLVSFDSGFLPKGFFSGILAIAFKKWRLSKKKNKPELYRNQATFYLTDNNSTITIKATAKYLEISQECLEGDNPSTLSNEILSTLSGALKDVCAKLGYGEQFCGWKFGFYSCTSLTGCPDSDDRHFAAISEDQDYLICSHRRTENYFKFDKLRQHWHEGIKKYSSHRISEKMIQESKDRIKNFVLHPECKKDAQGIVFIIRMFEAPGTTKNVEQIDSTFRSLNFAVLTFSDPTAAAITNLMTAVGSIAYPKNIKYIAVYYTGYGGIDDHGAQYIVPLQTDVQPSGESELDVLYVDEKVVQPLHKSEHQTRLLLFHCSNHINKKPQSHGEIIKPSSKGEIIAFTTSESIQDGSQQDAELSTGWTSTLCEKIMGQDKPIVTILNETAMLFTGQDDHGPLKTQYVVQIFTSQEKEIKDLKLTSSASTTPQEIDEYIETFEKCVKNKVSVSFLMAQVIPFGPPRVGKTCLYRRLLDQEPVGTRTTCDQSGKGSLSTDALSEGKIVQRVTVRNESAKTIVAGADGSKWNEVSSFQDHITICMKTTYEQQDSTDDKSHPQEQSSTLQPTLSSTTDEINKSHHRPSPTPVPTALKNTSNRMTSTVPSSTTPAPVASSFDGNDISEHHDEPSTELSNQTVNSAKMNKSAQPSEHVEESSLKIKLDEILDEIRNCENVDQLTSVKALLEDSLMIYFTDTGGQPEFHEILPALVAGPTIFLLAFSLFKDWDSKYEVDYESDTVDFKKYHNSFTVREVIMGCLSSISCFKNAQEQDLSHSVKGSGKFTQFTEPPIKVLMVGTHYDLIKDQKLEEINKSLRNELQLEASDLNNIIEQYHHADSHEKELIMIPINNFDLKDGEKLRKFFDRVVYSTRRGVNPFKITLPVNWLGFELSLKMLESSTIKYDDCKKLIKEFNMKDEMELKSCLHFLHYKTGTIRYYGSSVPELDDTVIIKPQVIFAAVTEFITCTFSSHNVSSEAIKNFKYYGLFKKEDVEAVFNAHERKLEITLEQFLALLKHLNILSEWQQHDKNEANYFFPCALTHIVRDKVDNNKSDPLLVSFDSGFLPKGVFSGILAIVFKKWPRISKKDSKPELYRNQAIFYLTDNNSTITIEATAKYLEISQQCLEGDNPRSLSIEILSTLSKALKDVCAKLGYGKQFCGWKFGFYCCKSLTRCDDSDDKHFAAISENQDRRLICSRTARSFKFNERQHWLEGIKNHSSHIVEKMVQENKARIKNCVALHPEYKDAQGIIFIIRMFGAPGTTKNVEEIHLIFRSLNFAVLTFSDPTAAAITNLMTAAGSFRYPENIKYIAVYYTGYGGIDDHGAQYIVPLQSNVQPSRESELDVLYVDETIVQPLRKSEHQTRLLLFHCSNINKKHQSHGETIKPASRGEIIAFTTSESNQDGSQIDKLSTGWTSTLCEKMGRQDKPIATILYETVNNGVVSGQDDSHGTLNTQNVVQIFTSQGTEIKELKLTSSSDNQATSQLTAASSHQKNDKHKVCDPPTHKIIFDSLKQKSVDWEKIGRECDVDLNYRETLRLDISITSAESKLERVIAKWCEQTKTPITWDSFTAVLRKLKFYDVIHKLKEKGYIIDNKQPSCICDSLKSSNHWKIFVNTIEHEVKDMDPDSSSDAEKLDNIFKKCMEKMEKTLSGPSHDTTEQPIPSVTESTVHVSQLKPITVQAVCGALKEYSSQWDDFARELEVDEDYRDELEEDSSLSDEEKLERIITRWIGTCEVSWNRIITVTGQELELETEKLKLASKICLMRFDVHKKVFKCLKSKSSCWNDLAQKLKIRDELKQSANSTDNRKLEKVIKEWLDESKGYEPTWEKIIRAVKELGWTKEVQELEAYSKESASS